MIAQLHKRIQHEGGAQLVEWIGIGAMLAALAIGVYSVLDGNGPLRAGISAVSARLAVNFGGDLASYGPRVTRPAVTVSVGTGSAGQMSIGQASDGQNSAGQTSIGQASDGQNSAGQTSIGQASDGQTSEGQNSAGGASSGQSSSGRTSVGTAGFAQSSSGRPSRSESSAGQPANLMPDSRVILDRDTSSYVLVEPKSRARLTVRPAPGVKATIDPASDLIHLEDSANNVAADLQPFDGQAILIDPITGVRTPADLMTLEQLGFVEVQQDQGMPSWWAIVVPALGVPEFLVPLPL